MHRIEEKTLRGDSNDIQVVDVSREMTIRAAFRLIGSSGFKRLREQGILRIRGDQPISGA